MFLVGEEVVRFKKGDEVIGLLPVDHYFDVKSKTCSLHEYLLGTV